MVVGEGMVKVGMVVGDGLEGWLIIVVNGC
jgi:hypothetical protein